MAKSTIGNISVNLLANVRPFSTGLKQASLKVKSFSTGLKATSAAVLGLGSVMTSVPFLATVGGFTAVLASNESFNRAMTRSLAIMGDVSDTMRGSMVEAAHAMAAETTFASKDMARSYFFLASAGLNVEQQLKALPIAAKFAQAGNFDMALASDLLTDAQSALGLSVKDTAESMKNMGHVSDVLVKANTLANASVQQFSESLTSGAAAAGRDASQSVEQIVSVLAAFADQGIKGADASTKYSVVMRDLQTKLINNGFAFRKLGVHVYDSNEQMRFAGDVVKDLERAVGGLSDKAKKTALLDLGFSDKSVGALQKLLGTSDKIQGYLTNLKDVEGVTNRVASKSMTDLEKATAKLGAAWDRFANRPEFSMMLTDIANGLESVAGGMNKLQGVKPMDLGGGLKESTTHIGRLESNVKFLEGKIARGQDHLSLLRDRATDPGGRKKRLQSQYRALPLWDRLLGGGRGAEILAEMRKTTTSQDDISHYKKRLDLFKKSLAKQNDLLGKAKFSEKIFKPLSDAGNALSLKFDYLTGSLDEAAVNAKGFLDDARVAGLKKYGREMLFGPTRNKVKEKEEKLGGVFPETQAALQRGSAGAFSAARSGGHKELTQLTNYAKEGVAVDREGNATLRDILRELGRNRPKQARL